jgi:hypothetical protein
MSYETLEPPPSGSPAGHPPAERPAELLPGDPQISVEAASDAPVSGWAEPILTKTERSRCTHWVRYADLNAKGRARRALSVTAFWSCWVVVPVGLFVGVMAFAEGIDSESGLVALVGLALSWGFALQAVSAVALALTWRRLHRPKYFVVGIAASGYTALLLGLGLSMAIVGSHHAMLVAAALPYGWMLWQLIEFRKTLYRRDTCRSYPWLPPAIVAMLKSPAASGAKRFRAADCPHRLEFGALRVRYRLVGVANTLLFLVYFAVVGLLWAMDPDPPFAFDGNWVVTAVLGLLFPVGNLLAVSEIYAHSSRYHRSPTVLYVGAFIGYATTVAVSFWVGLGVIGSLPVIALTTYWAWASVYSMKHLPPRSECANLREPPPAIKRMLRD